MFTDKSDMVDDSLANLGHQFDNPCIWFSNFPSCVLFRIKFNLYALMIRRDPLCPLYFSKTKNS